MALSFADVHQCTENADFPWMRSLCGKSLRVFVQSMVITARRESNRNFRAATIIQSLANLTREAPPPCSDSIHLPGPQPRHLVMVHAGTAIRSGAPSLSASAQDECFPRSDEIRSGHGKGSRDIKSVWVLQLAHYKVTRPVLSRPLRPISQAFVRVSKNEGTLILRPPIFD
jgi:hypothetical protein